MLTYQHICIGTSKLNRKDDVDKSNGKRIHPHWVTRQMARWGSFKEENKGGRSLHLKRYGGEKSTHQEDDVDIDIGERIHPRKELHDEWPGGDLLRRGR